jgi:hypothetical protein
MASRKSAALAGAARRPLDPESHFPQITAKLLGKTFEALATGIMVAPGIPVVGQVTAAPGRLM